MRKFLVLSEDQTKEWGKKWHLTDARDPTEAASQVDAEDGSVRVVEVTEPVTVVTRMVGWEAHHEESA